MSAGYGMLTHDLTVPYHEPAEKYHLSALNKVQSLPAIKLQKIQYTPEKCNSQKIDSKSVPKKNDVKILNGNNEKAAFSALNSKYNLLRKDHADLLNEMEIKNLKIHELQSQIVKLTGINLEFQEKILQKFDRLTGMS
ncbi:hypothetical protein PV325_011926 [Microctonus aethiopoides]|nr:hypothetical protein PV325_011926 [Microctonus aethiopoides]